MSTRVAVVTYWDASALLSALLPDDNSDEARRQAQESNERFYSSLGWVSDAAHAALTSDRWRSTRMSPRWDAVRRLARSWPLRGADLWHLAAAKRLQEELPTLRLLSFDRRLLVAAQGEGLP